METHGAAPSRFPALSGTTSELDPESGRLLLLVLASWLGLLLGVQVIDLLVCLAAPDYPSLGFRLFFRIFAALTYAALLLFAFDRLATKCPAGLLPVFAVVLLTALGVALGQGLYALIARMPAREAFDVASEVRPPWLRLLLELAGMILLPLPVFALLRGYLRVGPPASDAGRTSHPI